MKRLWSGCWQEWTGVMVLAGMYYILVDSVVRAAWLRPQPALMPVLFLALAAGFLLAKSRLPALLAHLVALLAGSIGIVWQLVMLQPASELNLKFQALQHSLVAWWLATISGRPSPGTIQIAVMFLLFTWIIGYISTWFFLRKHNAWLAVALGAVALLFNLSFLSSDSYSSFLWYMLASLVLVVLATSISQYRWFGRQPVHFARQGIRHLLPTAVGLVSIAVMVAWMVPQVNVQTWQDYASHKAPWADSVNGSLNNFFAAVPAQKPSVNFASMGGIAFAGPPNLNHDTLFVVQTDFPTYWRTKIYDTYTSQGWLTSIEQYETLKKGQNITPVPTPVAYTDVEYTVIPQVNTDVMLIAGSPISSDLAVKIGRLAPDDVAAVLSSKTLLRYQSYNVITRVPVVGAQQLLLSGEDYPDWVTSRYLQLPADFPDSIRQLAVDLTQGMTTPYDKAMAIRDYLSDITYSLSFDAPPLDSDGVEYFLFSSRTGDCVYFASAMAVMLRSVGVPVRLDGGYISGSWNEQQQGYAIRSSDSHVWPEVYFAGYGWVNFEATPGFATTGLNGLPAISPSAPVGNNVSAPAAATETPQVTQPEAAPSLLPTTSMPVDEIATGSDTTLPTSIPAKPSASTQPGDTSLAAAAPIATGNNSGSDTGSGPGRGNHFTPFNVTGAGFGALLGFASLALLLVWWRISFQRQVSRLRPDAIWLYTRLCFLASLAQLGPKPQKTALEHSRRLTTVFPGQAQAIQDIVDGYVVTRYGRQKELSPGERDRLWTAWRRVRRALMRRLVHLHPEE